MIRSFRIKTRTKTTLSLKNGVRVPWTVAKNAYLIGHYNSADLSLLSGFEELKKSLSVIKKSFVTLGKPLKYDECFVYIRDTQFLFPAGNHSLPAVGRLYSSEGDYNKIKISHFNLNNMDDF